MDDATELYGMDSLLNDRKLDVKRSGLLLYLLHSAGGVVDGRNKLEKMVYLAQKEGVPFDCNFDKFFYGPSSDSFPWVITLLKNIGMIVEKQIYPGNSKAFWREKYVMTELGESVIKKIRINEPHKKILDDIAREWKNKSEGNILSHVGEIWYKENKDKYNL